MPEIEIVDEVPPTPPFRSAKGAQLLRMAKELPLGKCLIIYASSGEAAIRYKGRIMGKTAEPRLPQRPGYRWMARIRKLEPGRHALMLWMEPIPQSDNPESPESGNPQSGDPQSGNE